ncbi:NUDIX domain-containing protein [Parabacteroides faecis]|uniref:NUDIX hydrolase n=1 Tax=Parabacteroides TaxID=375288 RepID=UPI000F005E14|nr:MULTISPECIES: NUDIX domain-containing protein [Parabacteroides]MBC8619297.1 NUDIX domain-containing protein [Parabacteroides faecis]RHR92806.1 NUDIX domain-containing protein [Parabacteroides sp. AF14-59]
MREEWFPLVNEEGETIGKATRRECHSGSKQLHPVIHLHIFNDAGELYLQKRSMNKDIQPGKWDTAVGGHIDYGETVEEALRREVREELGITEFTPQFMTRYIFESAIEKELVNTFRTVYNGEIQPDTEELDGGRFWSMEEIKTNLGKNVFTPNFEQEFRRLFL